MQVRARLAARAAAAYRATQAEPQRARIVVEAERISALNDAPERRGDYVLYWMQQSQRARCNPALEVAVAAANRLRLPVLVAFVLFAPPPRAQLRHYAFMCEGLEETARELQERGCGFVLRRGEPLAQLLELAQDAALVICDHGYLQPQQAWRVALARQAGRRVLRVEGDVVVPVRLASTRAEVAARTLRPKLARLRDGFLAPLPAVHPKISAARLRLGGTPEPGELLRLPARLALATEAGAVESFHGGYHEARRRLRQFVSRRLPGYRAARLLPGEPQVSTLSPYLHFGQISPVEVALTVRGARAAAAERGAFLEELIVRRELAANFVDFNPQYARYAGLPAWARQTLAQHAQDAREWCYGYEQLAAARSHDPYWNAAMREMRATGFMHNYMRMYWGKKVLEWSASPPEAHALLLRLNNSYFLDGRDASSYANVGWVFGLHDRPWPQRPLFGTVRYMNAAGLRRKTDIERYVSRWGG